MRIPIIWCSSARFKQRCKALSLHSWFSLRTLLCCLLLLSGQLNAALITGRQGCDTGQPLTLHSIANSYSDDLLLTPSTDTRQSSRRTVKVGVVIDANTPFVVNRDDNAIEGIVTTNTRIRQLVEEKTTPRNRDEQEIVGYRDVLEIIHENFDAIPITRNYILQLHILLENL